MEIVIAPDGVSRAIYGEAIDLASLGALEIFRASYVEPTATGRWLADLSPSQGPVLGSFPQRSAALAAETEWLAANWLAGDQSPRRTEP